MKRMTSIGRLFLLAFFFFLILPLAGVFFFFLTAIYDSSRVQVSQDLQAVAHAVASKVNTKLESPAVFLGTVADIASKSKNPDELEDLISSGIKRYNIFDSIYILDREKKVVRLVQSGDSKYNRKDFLGITLSNVVDGEAHEHHWSRPYRSLSTNNYIVRASVGYPGGYIVGDLNLQFLNETLIRANTKRDASVFIVDATGDIISDSNTETVMLQDNLYRHPAVKDVYKGSHVTFDYENRGRSQVGAGYMIPITGWYLIMEQSERAAFSMFYEIVFATCISAGLVTFFIIVVSYMIKNRLIVPIKLLTERSVQIAQGSMPEFSEREKNVFRELRKLYDSFEDMSEKIIARELELKNKEEYVRSIFDSTTNTGIMLISVEQEPVVIDANKGAELITGYKMSELLGLQVAALVKGVGEDISRMKRDAVSRDAMVTGRFEMVKKNGIAYPVMCSVQPFAETDGVVVSLIVVFVDITEVTRVQTALESEKERLDVTLKSIGEGVLATDKNGRITLLNSSAETILGQKYRFVMGQELKEVLRLYDLETGDDVSGEIGLLRNTSKKTMRANILSGSDKAITVTMTVSAMLSNKGEVLGHVYVFRDITDRIRMEQELLNRKKQLEAVNKNLEIRVEEETEKRRKNEQMLFEQAKFAAMGQMINAIAHQWRQPLNALALYVQDIEDAYDMGEINAQFVSRFVTNSMSLVNHMSATIDDFRNFFHSSNAKEVVSIVDVMVESISLVASQLRNQNISFAMNIVREDGTSEIHENITPPSGIIYGKKVIILPSELKQVILNILQNARDAIAESRTKQMRQAGQILIDIRFESESVALSISNDGGEIPKESLGSIFDPYYTTKAEGEGTGIGLYMSKIMVEEHMGGQLFAENIDGGAKFNIVLYYA